MDERPRRQCAAPMVFGAVPIEFYFGNAFFWIKMAALGTVAGISLVPTIQGIARRRVLATDPSYAPAVTELIPVRRSLVRSWQCCR